MEGDGEVMRMKFKGKGKEKIELNVVEGMVVEKNVNRVKF